MRSPFPGMDPYLEHSELWPEVHHRLITAIANAIAPPIRPKYRIAIEKRTYLTHFDDSILVGIPDVSVFSPKSTSSSTSSGTATLPRTPEAVTVTLPIPIEVKEGYLEIREVATSRVVTVIEIISPTNKRAGKGRSDYVTKREQVLGSSTHLVEIDLLRGGKPMPILGTTPNTDYRILVARGDRRPNADFYGFTLSQQIPKFLLPLQSVDTEPLVDLQRLLVQVYEEAGFELAVDYNIEPIPPLKSEDKNWVDALLRDKLNTH